MKERTQLSLKLILSHIILIPVLILISLLTTPDLFFPVTITQTILLILLFSDYWEFLGLRFKKIYFSFSEVIFLFMLLWKFFSFHKTGNNPYLMVVLTLIQAWSLFLLIKIFIVIFKHEKAALEIVFPFKEGKYLISDGGNSRISRLMNYHFYDSVHKKKKTNLSMLFATDIVKIKNYGSNYLPHENDDYPIFGEKVFSPVSGIVVKVENGIKDNIPYSGHYPYNTGNSVYSERPHIHIQLINSLTDKYWTGTGISLEYKGKNLYKNRLIKV